MAFLHCHHCWFSQDDFWSEHYNPYIFLAGLSIGDLLNPDDMDTAVKMDSNWLKENGFPLGITHRQLAVLNLERAISKVKEMKYRTFDEFNKKNPEHICPMCHRKTLDID